MEATSSYRIVVNICIILTRNTGPTRTLHLGPGTAVFTTGRQWLPSNLSKSTKYLSVVLHEACFLQFLFTEAALVE